jgi:hypothetical protein
MARASFAAYPDAESKIVRSFDRAGPCHASLAAYSRDGRPQDPSRNKAIVVLIWRLHQLGG